jgi:hypothetical protein
MRLQTTKRNNNDLMTKSLLHDAAHWRHRAQEMRALTSMANDPVTRELILKIAEDYERLAQRR